MIRKTMSYSSICYANLISQINLTDLQAVHLKFFCDLFFSALNEKRDILLDVPEFLLLITGC